MLIYEVNLTVNNAIIINYSIWLLEHIRQMLLISGFRHAEISEATLENHTTTYTVSYLIENEEDLNHYLTHQAATMHEEGLKKFSNQFTATRRVFLL